MSLKKLTKKNHSSAERSWFASLMMSGKISNEQYSIYLKQQYECYNALENRFNEVESINPMPKSLMRSSKIKEDIEELLGDFDNLEIFKSTHEYVDYIINECSEELLYAHVYVRYLGDLKGGQMIAKRIPGSGRYYKFEDPEKLESFIRKELNEEEAFVAECNKCFESAITLFKDLEDYFIK